MSLFSALKSMFSSDNSPSEPVPMQSEDYKGYSLTPSPMADGSQFRVNGTISKGELSHKFIRADVIATKEACAQEFLRKAKLMIDQVGDDLFK